MYKLPVGSWITLDDVLKSCDLGRSANWSAIFKCKPELRVLRFKFRERYPDTYHIDFTTLQVLDLETSRQIGRIGTFTQEFKIVRETIDLKAFYGNPENF